MMEWTTNLEERILLLRFELVWTENVKTAGSFLVGKTFLRAFKKFEHILNHDGLQVNLLLVVEVLSLELNLRGGKRSIPVHQNVLSVRESPWTCRP